MTKGCVHICVKDGKIQNVFCHLSDLPKDGVVHMLPDKTLNINHAIAVLTMGDKGD